MGVGTRELGTTNQHRILDVNALLHEMTALRSVANFTFVKLRKVPKLKRNGNEQMTQFPEMFGRLLEV